MSDKTIRLINYAIAYLQDTREVLDTIDISSLTSGIKIPNNDVPTYKEVIDYLVFGLRKYRSEIR